MEKVANILLVEDDQLDTMDIKRSLEKLKILYQLHEAKNGEEAIAVLNRLEEGGLSHLPDVLLIDINMPRMNGLELLQVIRNSEKWKHLNSPSSMDSFNLMIDLMNVA